MKKLLLSLGLLFTTLAYGAEQKGDIPFNYSIDVNKLISFLSSAERSKANNFLANLSQESYGTTYYRYLFKAPNYTTESPFKKSLIQYDITAPKEGKITLAIQRININCKDYSSITNIDHYDLKTGELIKTSLIDSKAGELTNIIDKQYCELK